MSKVKTGSFNPKMSTGTAIYVTVDIFKFIKDEDLHNPEVWIENDGGYEYFDEIITGLPVTNHEELKEIALKWILKNVSIVDDFEEGKDEK